MEADKRINHTNSAQNLLIALSQCLRFYSRLPVPKWTFEHDPHAVPDFAIVPRVLPIAGAIIGVPSAVILVFLSWLGCSGPLAACFAVLGSVLVTGALHEDGLADVADGFGGGRTRERRLEIMADSRVGAYGAAAMVLALLIRVTAIGDLTSACGFWAAAMAVIAAASLSRISGLLPLVFLTPARPGGRSASVGRPSPVTITFAVIASIMLSLAFLLIGGFHLRGIALSVIFSYIVASPMIVLSERMIGGQTGDVAGATQQVAEIVFLTTLLVA
jgi:adenosylcobinamide-GDP ribazoletransferase